MAPRDSSKIIIDGLFARIGVQTKGTLTRDFKPLKTMETLTTLFSGPLLLPTMLVMIAALWGAVSSLTSVFHQGDFHIDNAGPGTGHDIAAGHDIADPIDVGSDGALSTDGHSGSASMGNVGTSESLMEMLHWLNFGAMPLVFWLAVFSLVWWFVSVVFWGLIDKHFFAEPGIFWTSLLMLRNLAVTLPLTKYASLPLAHWDKSDHLNARSLIGRECEISSSTAGPAFGQVKFKTDGAPLLLNVRTDGTNLVRGTRVWITHYDQKKRIYQVSSLEPVASVRNRDIPN